MLHADPGFHHVADEMNHVLFGQKMGMPNHDEHSIKPIKERNEALGGVIKGYYAEEHQQSMPAACTLGAPSESFVV
jgi:hypothetical protein